MSGDRWEVVCGDSREVLATLRDGCVDAVVADPPYGVTSLEWDRQVSGWMSAVGRVLKSNGSLWVFGSLASFLNPVTAAELRGWRLVQDVVWEKHNGSNPQHDRFRRVHELVVQFVREEAAWSDVYHKPQVTLDAVKKTIRRKQRPPHWGVIDGASYTSEDGGPRLMRSVIHCPSCHGYAEHPTQKPVDLLRPIVAYSCPPDGIVLDPFAGSGSTGVAALREGFRFLGIEREENYCEIARRRIAEAEKEKETTC